MIQAALLQVAEATKAAALAAASASAAASSASSGGSGGKMVDWSKLLTKPPQFDFQTTEEEIKAFRDWSWQLTQYLTAIDEGFDKELQQLFDDPSKALDMVAAGAETRTQCQALWFACKSGEEQSLELGQDGWWK